MEEQTQILREILGELRRIGSILEGFEQKNQFPISMMIDGNRSNLENKTRKSHKNSSEAVSFVLAHEWLFVRASNGGYSYAIANQAAENFLKNHGPSDRELFSKLLRAHQSSLKGRVFLVSNIFEILFKDLSRIP